MEIDGGRTPFIVNFDTRTERGVWHRELVSRSVGNLSTMIKRGGEPLDLFPIQNAKIPFRIVVRNIEHPANNSPDA